MGIFTLWLFFIIAVTGIALDNIVIAITSVIKVNMFLKIFKTPTTNNLNTSKNAFIKISKKT